MNPALERALRRTVITKSGFVIKAKNSAFPKAAENVALRVQWQDIDASRADYRKSISREAVK